MSHYQALKSGRRIYSAPVLTVLVSLWKVRFVLSRGTGPRHPTWVMCTNRRKSRSGTWHVAHGKRTADTEN
jgi:hypothetical protein